jgi:hypothetical protein
MRLGGLSIAVVALTACVSGCAVGLNPRVTDVKPTEAMLAGDIFTTTGGDVTWWFDYGKTAAYGKSTAHIVGSSLPENSAERESLHVTGLDSASVYHFRLCARDSEEGSGPGCSRDGTFTTLGDENADFIYGNSVFGTGGLSKQLDTSPPFTLVAEYQRNWFPSVLREGSALRPQSVVRVQREPSGCNAPAAICASEFQDQWDGQATARVTCLSLVGGRAVIGTESLRGDITEPPQLLTVVDDPSGDRFKAVELSDAPSACPAPPTDVSGIPPTGISDSFVVHDAPGLTAAKR